MRDATIEERQVIQDNIDKISVTTGINFYDDITIKDSNVFGLMQQPSPNSILWIGDKYYKTSLPSDQHFNWFQKLMWKLCFGVKIKDYSEV